MILSSSDTSELSLFGFKGLAVIMYVMLSDTLCKQTFFFFFHSRTVHLDIIKVLLPTDAQENCFKRSIKIYIKTTPTCFGVTTAIRERTI